MQNLKNNNKELNIKYNIEMTYMWYLSIKAKKSKIFSSKSKAILEKKRIISKINKDWWLNINNLYWDVQSLYIFKSQIYSIAILIIQPTESIRDVSKILD